MKQPRATFLIVLFILFALLTAVLLAQPLLANHHHPTTAFVVTATDDTNDGLCDDHCSLREAITAANSTAGADTITFNLLVTGTITLSGTQLPLITDTLTIDGGTAPGLNISGANTSRIFEISSSTAVTITYLKLINGESIHGGGLYNEGTLTLLNTTFYHNRADYGGAILNAGHLTIYDSTVTANSAFSYVGGGISNGGTLALYNSTLEYNNAFEGGAILNEGSLTIESSTFRYNMAVYGAGIFNQTILTLTNNLFIFNEAGDSGGGMYNTGTLTSTNNTLHSNWAIQGSGDGLVNSGTLYWYNTVIAAGSDHANCTNNGTIAANVNNFVLDGSCDPAMSGSPGLGYDHMPQPGSRLIDSGDNAVCPPTDIRGRFRPLDSDGDGSSVCDIGAFETLWGFPLYLPLIESR